MRYIKKFTINNWTLAILLIWRAFLFIPQWWGIANLQLQASYIGGGVKNYLLNPYIWSWANFDGEHYLAIARFGYKPLTYFFFPLYPIIVKFFAEIIGKSEIIYLIAGIIISSLSFVLGIFYLIKLLKLDYKEFQIKNIILMFIFFPTAFFFVGVYTESLFFLLIVLSFYFARKGNWWLAGVIGSLACATRLAGIVLLPALFTEMYKQGKRNYIPILFIPLGLIFYMLYLQNVSGDALAFFHQIEIFGDQRSSSIITLPQVFYRYIFKILPNLTWSYFPQVFITLFEFIMGVLILIMGIYSLVRLRLSYAILLVGGYILPTISGSFSSLPRYAIVLFPAFIILSLWISKIKPIYRYVFYFSLLVLQFIALSLFSRGYWVS